MMKARIILLNSGEDLFNSFFNRKGYINLCIQKKQEKNRLSPREMEMCEIDLQKGTHKNVKINFVASNKFRIEARIIEWKRNIETWNFVLRGHFLHDPQEKIKIVLSRDKEVLETYVYYSILEKRGQKILLGILRKKPWYPTWEDIRSRS